MKSKQYLIKLKSVLNIYKIVMYAHLIILMLGLFGILNFNVFDKYQLYLFLLSFGLFAFTYVPILIIKLILENKIK